jgi:hypothetical protein
VASLSLPDVEARPQRGIYENRIAAATSRQAEYAKLWDLLAFTQEFTVHLARFSHGVLRRPATIGAGLRGLIAADTSSQTECALSTKAPAAAEDYRRRVPEMSAESRREQGRMLATRGYARD